MNKFEKILEYELDRIKCVVTDKFEIMFYLMGDFVNSDTNSTTQTNKFKNRFKILSDVNKAIVGYVYNNKPPYLIIENDSWKTFNLYLKMLKRTSLKYDILIDKSKAYVYFDYS